MLSIQDPGLVPSSYILHSIPYIQPYNTYMGKGLYALGSTKYYGKAV
jgi:hypothetical protein